MTIRRTLAVAVLLATLVSACAAAGGGGGGGAKGTPGTTLQPVPSGSGEPYKEGYGY